MTLKTAATIAALATPALATPGFAVASTWDADPAHSSAGFTVTHLMISKVRGQFDNVQASLELNEKDLSKSTVKAVIETASIDTNNAKRDEHLKSADFFDAANNPQITFESTAVKKAGKDQLKVTGQLTMNGQTHEVTLAVELTPATTHPFTGKPVRAATATTKIDRTKWGLAWNHALETGGVLVSNEVEISLDVQFVQKDEKDEQARR